MNCQEIITELIVKDIRFPTSLELHGSDAMHDKPDYSCAYVTLTTSLNHKGFGLSFTIGRGNEIVAQRIEALKHLLIGKRLADITGNFGKFWHNLVNEPQLRWLGPEKGAIHLGVSGIINAIWDLWARIEGKPVWKLLFDLSPERLVNVIDFTYITDFITKEEAIQMLQNAQSTKFEREKDLLEKGYPAYTTSAGWLGYTDAQIIELCKEAQAKGFSRFKMKVGGDVEDDIRRIKLLRNHLGDDAPLMTDANQRWTVEEAVQWMQQLAPFKPYWIEEPTCADDILGHAAISAKLNPLGIKVATGECCQNRVMFKQFLQSRGLQVCQIDCCRLGGINEVLAVLLMAAKAGVPVCPHAGGVGLCEYVQHIVMFDYCCISQTMEGRMCEYSDHLHEHFEYPVKMQNGCYMPPQDAGYSAEMLPQSLEDHSYPDGAVWLRLTEKNRC